MENKDYIESGILELYVYGLLSESENEEVAQKAKSDPAINAEIIAIEKSIIALSSGFSPFQSVENFEKIKEKLDLKHQTAVVQLKSQNNRYQYMGWAAAVLLLLGIGFQYKELQKTANEVVNIERDLNQLVLKNKTTETNLAIIRDANNTVVALGGQAVAPKSYAKVYWNKDKQTVYIDASGLPEPPKGMVYQVWALKLNPLTPTSIGLLANFKTNNQRFFEVEKTQNAEAFGITLEPAGGSISPTMEQLYTLGKV